MDWQLFFSWHHRAVSISSPCRHDDTNLEDVLAALLLRAAAPVRVRAAREVLEPLEEAPVLGAVRVARASHLGAPSWWRHYCVGGFGVRCGEEPV